MAAKEFGKEWTRSTAFKSAWLFFMHFLIFMLLAALLVLGDKWGNLTKNFREHVAD